MRCRAKTLCYSGVALGGSRYLSLTRGGSLTQAAFGSESAGGGGRPVFEDCHKIPSGSIPLITVHPDKAGGTTLSKLSFTIVINWPLQGGGLESAGARVSIRAELLFSAACVDATAAERETNPSARPAMACEESIISNMAMPVVTRRSKQEILC